MKMLEGIRIVDLTTVIFGPYATQMLGDLGAEIIKIESPTGDTPRYMGAFKNTPYMGGTHMTVNRGKKSVVLDLKKPEDAEVLRKLIASADIFVHNVRAKSIGRLGFGYEDVKAMKPDIIYAHFAGFSQDGPWADWPAYDDVIQAATGTTSLLPKVDGNPAPRYFPSLIADKVSGTYGAQALLAALVHKLRCSTALRTSCSPSICRIRCSNRRWGRPAIRASWTQIASPSRQRTAISSSSPIPMRRSSNCSICWAIRAFSQQRRSTRRWGASRT
jgi:crotonobetainyl-CoA:carnitine CoA-transferase CaiB-like acyl-CoA transferase